MLITCNTCMLKKKRKKVLLQFILDTMEDEELKERLHYVFAITRDWKNSLLRFQEDRTRKMYKQHLEEIRADFSREVEKEARKQTGRAIHQESIEFEKMRCEKRLLQDKYMALKEKYMKLKNEVRSAIERRSRRKEGYTTASETERSTSTRTRTDITESSEQKWVEFRFVASLVFSPINRVFFP